MDILVCIDDTDNLESIGTGKLAAIMCDAIEKNHWGICRPITRHQMFVHPDIPYTSHNSAMCFVAEIGREFLHPFTVFAQSFLARESAPGSDPGLCIIKRDSIIDPDALMAFGKKAKSFVVTKEEAYGIARYLNVHLSEHGGTGQGIIGALAGCGLRLGGDDGRIRGHFHVTATDGSLRVDELIQQTGVDVVKGLDGARLRGQDIVRIGEKIKAVFKDHKLTLLVCADMENQVGDMNWRTCTKDQLRSF